MKNNRIKEDQEIRDIYQRIKEDLPSELGDLPKKYEIEYCGKNLGAGGYGRVFELEKGVVGKVLSHGWIRPMQREKAFEKIVKEYSNQKLSFEIGLKVPEPYILVSAYDKTTKANYPLLVMEKINGDTLSNIRYREGDYYFLEEAKGEFINERFKKERDNVMKYLTEDMMHNDIGFQNAFWIPEEKRVRLFDCANWDFKALQ